MRKLLCLAVVLIALAVIATAQNQPSLKDAYKSCFLVGTAVNPAQTSGDDKLGTPIVEKQFNSITPENALKWERVHPTPDNFDFQAADSFVSFGERNHMVLIGHTLVWHNQTPKRVFEDKNGRPLTRDQLLERLRDHINTVVGRYKGKIKAWDVVNEALDEDGKLRQTPWMKIIGEDYIAKAFEYAHQADPKAELNYNDYSLENEPKRNGAVALIKKLKAQGVPVNGVGLQGHLSLDWPSVQQEDETVSAFKALGVKVMITELDIDVLPAATTNGVADPTINVAARPDLNPYPNGLPDSMQQELAKRYAGLFRVYLKHRDAVTRVTFWGVTDADSWRNNWPVRGRTSYPLLFDRDGKPKPAFNAVISEASPSCR
jgi:endo-1,4-beta-xylanase